MKIQVHRNETSKPIMYEAADNAYTKGGMYCILFKKNDVQLVDKYPLCSLFRITEEYK